MHHKCTWKYSASVSELVVDEETPSKDMELIFDEETQSKGVFENRNSRHGSTNGRSSHSATSGVDSTLAPSDMDGNSSNTESLAKQDNSAVPDRFSSFTTVVYVRVLVRSGNKKLGKNTQAHSGVTFANGRRVNSIVFAKESSTTTESHDSRHDARASQEIAPETDRQSTKDVVLTNFGMSAVLKLVKDAKSSLALSIQYPIKAKILAQLRKLSTSQGNKAKIYTELEAEDLVPTVVSVGEAAKVQLINGYVPFKLVAGSSRRLYELATIVQGWPSFSEENFWSSKRELMLTYTYDEHATITQILPVHHDIEAVSGVVKASSVLVSGSVQQGFLSRNAASRYSYVNSGSECSMNQINGSLILRLGPINLPFDPKKEAKQLERGSFSACTLVVY